MNSTLWSDSRGFSLIESLIAVAVFGIIVLAKTQLDSNTLRAQGKKNHPR